MSESNADINIPRRNAPIPFASYLSFNIKEIWRGLRQEPWSFWFLCFYLFLEYTRVQSIYPIIGLLPLGQMSLLFCFFLVLTGNEKKWVKVPTTIPFAILLLHICVSSLMAFDPSISWEYIPTMINWLLLYYCMLAIVTTYKRLFIVILLIILATFKMANHAALSFALRGFAFQRWGISGPPGWFGDAADLATQILIYICLVIGFLLVTRGKLPKWVHWLFIYMIAAGLLTIIAAGNRGAIVAMAAMALFILLFLKNRFRNFFSIFLLCAILFAASPAEFKERFNTVGSDNTSQERLLQWERGYITAKKYPVLGIGYENWNTYMLDKYYSGFVAHNVFITVLAELGFVGLFWYLVLMFTIFTLNNSTRRIGKSNQDKFAEIMSMSLNVGLVAYAAAGMFISISYYPFLYVQLALTAALYNIAKQKKLSSVDSLR